MSRVSKKQSQSTERKRGSVSAYREKVSVVSKRDPADNDFSFNWVILSVFGYLGLQIALSILGHLFVFPFTATKHTEMMAQGLIIIAGFYIGAFIIGVISPGRRTIEPVLGAVLAVGAAFSVSNFTPQMGGWYQMQGVGSMGTAAVMAGVIAAFGAYSGEKMMGNFK